MRILIEVFIHSSTPYKDYELYRETSQHAYCMPGTFNGLVTQAVSQLKGRILSSEDIVFLEQVSQIADKAHEIVKIHDVSRMADRIRALKHGILKTPAVIINGKKYESLEEISTVLGKSIL